MSIKEYQAINIYTKELKINAHRTLYMDVFNNFIRNCQNLEETYMSFSWWIKKETVVHPDNRILFNTKKIWAIKL